MRMLVLMLLFAACGAWAEEAKTGADSPLVKYFQPYAMQGNVSAQLSLGSTYYNGKMVSQDYLEAVKWFRMAAQQGNATAQNYLGLMYLNGLGVTRDPVRASMWSGLADASKQQVMILSPDELTKMREQLAGQLTPQQVEAAHKMAQDCLAKDFKGCD